MPPSSAPRATHPDKTLLTAWLLLLLRDGDSYGWALFGQLRDRMISVDASRAYRMLRDLEHEGSVSSHWTQSDAGPQRRSYRLTPKGRRTLAELAELVTATWQLHEAFVRAHERAPAERDRPADEAPAGSGEHLAGDQPDQPARQPDDDAHALTPPTRTPPPTDPSAPTPRRELVAAWLLLLLDRGASYGYGLRRALDEHQVHPDPATLYRVLRRLESVGWLESRWMRPAAGPRRRFYRVTTRGRRNLGEIARGIIAVRDSHGAFLHAYDRAPERTPVPPPRQSAA